LAQGLFGAFAPGHVALNAEVSGDSAGGIVEAEVVPFNRYRRAIELALVGFHVQPSRLEKAPPHFAAVREVVFIKIIGGEAEELLARRAVLREHGIVDFGHALVQKDIIQNLVFVDGVVPAHRLVEHHEKEAVERLRKKQFEAGFAFTQNVFGAMTRRRAVRSIFSSIRSFSSLYKRPKNRRARGHLY